MTSKRRDVVIIEDDPLLSAQYIRTLSRSGFSSFATQNVIDGIQLIDDIKPSVIVADVLLTASTILTLLHELRSHQDLAKIPVVVVSTIAEHFSLDELAPYGVKVILDKTTMLPGDIVDAVERSAL